MIKFLLLIVVSFCSPLFPSLAHADAPLSFFGPQQAQYSALPHDFKVINWNIYKGGKDGMAKDFSALAMNADVALLQEAYETPDLVKDLTTANQELSWALVRAFKHSGYYTGVATGSRVQPLKTVGYHSVVHEPIMNTPKTMLLTEYALSTSTQTLLVLNVHAINFVLNSSYKKQIQQIVEIVKGHQGPLLIAGDFNTWNSGRMSFLEKSMQALGATHLALKNQKSLDHVFIRGIDAQEGVVIENIKSSDHKPIVLQLSARSAAMLHAAGE